jgi:hypothetical protein
MYVIKRAPGVRICNEDFTPNRENSSCQEMIGHILRGLSMGTSGRLVQGSKVQRLIERDHI